MTAFLQEKLVRYIIGNVKRDLFLSLDEAIGSAYLRADQRVTEDIQFTSRTRPRAQLRRYYIDDAIAGAMSSGSPSVVQTVPKGEHYIVVCSGNISLSHIELHEDAFARPAKHRKMLAMKNAILEPLQYDFFNKTTEDLADSLHLVAVVLHPSTQENNQSAPKRVLITVPYTNWQGYHLEIDLKDLLKSYNQTGTQGVVDEAWPTLKEALKKEEL